MAIDAGNAEQVGIDMMNMNGLINTNTITVFSVLVTHLFVDAMSTTKKLNKTFHHVCLL